MSVISAIKQAWQVYCRQLPDVLQYTLLTLAVHAMPLAPLLGLVRPETRLLALASPLLFVLLVLPMRQNAAAVMQRALRGSRLLDAELVSFTGYDRKLAAGLKQLLKLLVWALPALAVTGAGIWLYTREGVHGQTDVITLLKPIKQLGGSGKLQRGLVYALLMYLSLWLPLAVGCAFHSGDRHHLALTGRRFRGCRGRQMLAWLAAQCTLLPWLCAMAVPVCGYVSSAIQAVERYEFSGLVPSGSMLLSMAVMTLLLLTPVLPLRDLIIAALPAQQHSKTEAQP